MGGIKGEANAPTYRVARWTLGKKKTCVSKAGAVMMAQGNFSKPASEW